MNNTDDHLRNHGLLRSGSGWCLSPVFDINPNPDATATRVTRVFNEIGKEAAMAAICKNANSFDLTQQEAEVFLADVKSAMKSCEIYANKAAISKSGRTQMFNTLGL
jgi:serine/threonine-protein kinase HipA